jgi:hypothetical protein
MEKRPLEQNDSQRNETGVGGVLHGRRKSDVVVPLHLEEG